MYIYIDYKLETVCIFCLQPTFSLQKKFKHKSVMYNISKDKDLHKKLIKTEMIVKVKNKIVEPKLRKIISP